MLTLCAVAQRATICEAIGQTLLANAVQMVTSAPRYRFQVDLSNRGTQPTQLILLVGRNKRVLEVGPATGYITRVLQERGCRVTAVEKDPSAAAAAASSCERVIGGGVEAAKVLRGGGYVVASVPNVAHGSVRLALLDGAFPYTERGLLDYTHLRF